MANVPYKFTQEAQDEKDRKMMLENPKSRHHFVLGEGMTDKEWNSIFKDKNGRKD